MQLLSTASDRPGTRAGYGIAMAHAYMLRCRDGTLYVGSTINLDDRLAAHEAGMGAE